MQISAFYTLLMAPRCAAVLTVPQSVHEANAAATPPCQGTCCNCAFRPQEHPHLSVDPAWQHAGFCPPHSAYSSPCAGALTAPQFMIRRCRHGNLPWHRLQLCFRVVKATSCVVDAMAISRYRPYTLCLWLTLRWSVDGGSVHEANAATAATYEGACCSCAFRPQRHSHVA